MNLAARCLRIDLKPVVLLASTSCFLGGAFCTSKLTYECENEAKWVYPSHCTLHVSAVLTGTNKLILIRVS